MTQTAAGRISPIQKELAGLFDQDKALTIFEVGSCNGNDAVTYGRLFPRANVFAFEPVPSNFQKLQKNLSENQLPNVKGFALAMSDKQGETPMHVSSGSTEKTLNENTHGQSSSLLSPDKHLEVYPWYKFDNVITVKTDTLENFCKINSIASIDFLHLDVQGAELMVLKGAGNFISQIKSIWLEVEHIALYKDQPLRKDIEDFMHSNGYVLMKFRVGGYSGDQLYVTERFAKEKLGSFAFASLKLKSMLLRSAIFILMSRYLRKLKFLINKQVS